MRAFLRPVNIYQIPCNLVSQSLPVGADIPLTEIKYLYLLSVLLSVRS